MNQNHHKSRRVRIYCDKRSASARTIDITLDESGAITVDGVDVGPLVESTFGDSDLEFWTIIPSDQVPALCFALLQDKLAGQENAVAQLAEYCAAQGLGCKQGSWA